MSKNKRRNKRKAKRSKKSGKLTVKKKFSAAINKLRRLKCNQQRTAVSGASNEFINDISRRLKTTPNLVSSKHKRSIRKHKSKFKQLSKNHTQSKASDFNIERWLFTIIDTSSWYSYWWSIWEMNFQLRSDRVMCVAGPSQSGKTEFVLRLLESKEELFRNPLN